MWTKMKMLLTDRFIRGLKAPPVKRTIIWDAVVPGAYLCVTPTGNISYNIMKRIRGRLYALRRMVGYAWKIGQPLPISHADLRDMARTMLLDLAKGIDPKAKALAAREGKEQSPRSTFAAVVADFLAHHVAGLPRFQERDSSGSRQTSDHVDHGSGYCPPH
jgi:hypothetical protein